MQTNLLKPKSINVEPLGGHRAKVTLEPFERGYGHTLGNALRRVLLSSMVGYAPTEVTIAGVLHEYSTVDGVQEDVVGVMLNLKGVTFRLHNREEVTLILRKEGEGPVTAADIQTPHDVEIINPDHVICHLAQGGKIDMQIKVEKGRGYVAARCAALADEPIARRSVRILLDASFSPVRRVSATRSRSARVEQRTDLDKSGDGYRNQRRDLAGRSRSVTLRPRSWSNNSSAFAHLQGTDLMRRLRSAKLSVRQSFDPILLQPGR